MDLFTCRYALSQYPSIGANATMGHVLASSFQRFLLIRQGGFFEMRKIVWYDNEVIQIFKPI